MPEGALVPKLKGKDLAPHAVASTHRTVAGDDEIVVGCPLLQPCGWERVRPMYGAHSAQVAHQMGHDRGLW